MLKFNSKNRHIPNNRLLADMNLNAKCFAIHLLILFLPMLVFSQNTDSIKVANYYHKANEFGYYHHQYQVYMDSVLMVQPTNAYYWQQKGMPLLKANKAELGMPYLDSAVKYKPDYIDYRAFMKCVFQRDYKGAISDFEKAIQLKGHSFIMDHSFEFYMGLSYLQLNNLTKADSLIRLSTKFYDKRNITPHYLELFYLGIIEMEKGNFQLAINQFDEVLKQYKQLPDAHYYKAWCTELLHLHDVDPNAINKDVLQLYNQGLENLKQGYAINEDSSFYMDYPYQVRKTRYEFAIKRLTQKL